MRLAPVLLLALVASSACAAPRETKVPAAALATAAQLREQAIADDTGWRVVESLTTEVGPRLAGSEANARAVEWAKAKFKQLGYDKVWTQDVSFPKWERRSEHGAVLGTHAQPLALTALGGSPGGTVEGAVVRFESLDALQAAPDGSLAGKIAYVDYRMKPFRDGHDYGVGSRIRTEAPSAAIRKGAIGYVMRSAGTDSHRVPHTGITRFDDGLTPIPSAALAAPDADQLTRLLALGATRIHVALDCGWNGQTTSQNVIGEITGTKASEVVVIGGHLDSWDLGTGAIDDASGVAITMAAGHLIGKMKRPPMRTIRVIAYANEEQGLFGAKAYAESQSANIAKHQLIAESDFGAGRIYAFDSNAPDYAKGAVKQIADALAPLGIAYAPGEGDAGSDASASSERGVSWASLSQDGTDYFDLHHTADDTLDKIDAKALAQNVAAYAVFAYLAAAADGDFGSAPKTPAAAQP